jgi:REP element-mobilizing transposase RayT
MTSSPGSKALRRGRVSEPGRIYLITAVAWNRAALFVDYRVAREISKIIDSSKSWTRADCLAWVLMPDHVHALVQLHDDGDLSKAIRRMKSQVTQAFRREGRLSPVWQKGFHDRALRKDDDVREAARYLVGNPVRAGIARRAAEYPYWNAIWVGK